MQKLNVVFQNRSVLKFFEQGLTIWLGLRVTSPKLNVFPMVAPPNSYKGMVLLLTSI